MFLLKHQDGDVKYDVENCGFAIEDGFLFISIQCRAIDEDGFPDAYFFALDAYPLGQPLKGEVIRISTNPNDEPPNVYVYTNFHACEVEAEIEFLDAYEEKLIVRLESVTEDVNYYDERAKRTPFNGTCELPRKTKSDLWIPS